MLAIFILVAIVFKSLLIPLILVASIELAIWVNISISTLTGTTICFIAPTIISCVQLGATVDYAILMTTRFREELRKCGDKLKAIKIAAKESSRSIFQSALVFFSATFGVYCICDIDIVKGVCLMLARGSVISDFAIKHRRVIAIIFLVLFIPSYFLQNNVKKYYNMDKAIPQDLPSISALNTMKKDFNMATTHFIILDDKITEANINALLSMLTYTVSLFFTEPGTSV
jgi:predicted RND superfamily exporter protein